MPILSRDAILSAPDIKTETIPVPEWGGEVMVKALNGAERDAFESSMVKFSPDGKNRSMNLANIRAKLASMAICDEQGNRMFSDADVMALAKKSAAALDRVFTVAQRLSGLTDSDVDELAKNSGSAPADGSPSA